MGLNIRERVKPVHAWLRRIHVAYVPTRTTPLLDEFVRDLLARFSAEGHSVETVPTEETEVILTAVPYGEVVHWRRALMLTSRRRFNLEHSPTTFTLVHITPRQLGEVLERLRIALAKEPADPADFAFDGLLPQAFDVLLEQGRRGGPIMALERLLQAQTKSIRILLVVGEERPLSAYYFDLAGACPQVLADDPDAFYGDLVLRIVTPMSTTEITQHQVVEGLIPREVWRGLETTQAMRVAGRQLNDRHFFTQMIRIADLVQIPAVGDAVSSQYSEGCFATWDATLQGLVATITGSARPVNKGEITEDDLAVIVGVRPDGQGALVRHVEDKFNAPPSSESVEMVEMDVVLPRITLPPEWGIAGEAPVVRSKLHGHRGVSAYDPRYVEYVPLDEPFFHYLVSCATEAQARGIVAAFARSVALHNPADPRQMVFTVLPGHGVLLAEKWVPGTVPFQTIWEYMDRGYIEIANLIPQGPFEFAPGADGRRYVRDL